MCAESILALRQSQQHITLESEAAGQTATDEATVLSHVGYVQNRDGRILFENTKRQTGGFTRDVNDSFPLPCRSGN